MRGDALATSTRGGLEPQPRFSDILLGRLAPDGGLVVPEPIPRIDAADLRPGARWTTGARLRAAAAVRRRHPGRRPARALSPTYTADLRFAEITPVDARWSRALHLLRLSNGPTLAFKDVAMQLLGNLFEYVLARRRPAEHPGRHLGRHRQRRRVRDARQAGRPRVHALAHGRMSPFQRAQMYSLRDANIFNIAVAGVFDDCQDMVKASPTTCRLQGALRDRHGQLDQLGAHRRPGGLLLQGLLRGHAPTASRCRSRALRQLRQRAGRPHRAHDGPADPPTGGGHQRERRARRVLPHRRYRAARTAETHQTSSPSMDISKASNFERFVFDLVGHATAPGRRHPITAGGPPDPGPHQARWPLPLRQGRQRVRQSGRVVAAPATGLLPGIHRTHSRFPGSGRPPHRRRPGWRLLVHRRPLPEFSQNPGVSNR
jgi:threonine synthase